MHAGLAHSVGEHHLVPVCEGKLDGLGWRLLWEFLIPTAASVGSNCPDLVLVRGPAALLIDTSVPLDGNMPKKILKRKDHEIPRPPRGGFSYVTWDFQKCQ